MGLGALSATRWETARGAVMITIAVFCAFHLHAVEPDLATVSVLMLFLAGSAYLAAPFMAILGERDLSRQTQISTLPAVIGDEILELVE